MVIGRIADCRHFCLSPFRPAFPVFRLFLAVLVVVMIGVWSGGGLRDGGDFASKIYISLLIHLERLGIRATLRFAGGGSDTGVIGAEKTGVIRVTCPKKHMTRTSPLSLGGDIHVTTFPFFFGVCPCSLSSLFNLLYFLT